MTEQMIFERLNDVFRDIFDDDSITVGRETTADDIEDWDSLEHIRLIGAVEREFGVKFTMKNVGEMADIIAERTAK